MCDNTKSTHTLYYHYIIYCNDLLAMKARVHLYYKHINEWSFFFFLFLLWNKRELFLMGKSTLKNSYTPLMVKGTQFISYKSTCLLFIRRILNIFWIMVSYFFFIVCLYIQNSKWNSVRLHIIINNAPTIINTQNLLFMIIL